MKKTKKNKTNRKNRLNKGLNKEFKRGFSLIEVIVFIAIVTLCILALGSVYYNIIKAQNKIMYEGLLNKKLQTYFNLYIENKRQLYLKFDNRAFNDIATNLQLYATQLLNKLKKDRDLSDLDILELHALLLDKNQSEINALAGIYSQKDYQQLIKYYLKLRIVYKIKDQNKTGELVSYLPVIVENQTAPISKFYEITLSAETTTPTIATGSTNTPTIVNGTPTRNTTANTPTNTLTRPPTTPTIPSGGCFELSSLILTKEQDKYILKKISDIRIGDIVLTIDPVENYKLKEIEVEKLHIHDEKEYEIMEIITESGNKLRLTPNHPIIIDENNNFKKAYKIKEGEKILVYSKNKSKWERIKEIKKEIIKDKVMTLELKDYINTFLISNDGNTFTLVHSGYQKMNIYKTIGINFLLLSLTTILQSAYATGDIIIAMKNSN
jgi:type II secretory pathway pseudopilin PulG